jgi:hypothetical protein
MQLAARAPTARRFSSITPTRPTRWPPRCKALRPHVMGRLSWSSAPAATATGQAPADGAGGGEHADVVIVTDDNPRSEDPAAIRAAVMAGCPEATEVGDRAEAILRGVDALEPGDALLIAARGMRPGRSSATTCLPFDDAEQASVAVAALDGGPARMTAPLWTAPRPRGHRRARRTGRLAATGVSIDSRTLAPGDLFVALKAARDGHDFVADALAKGGRGGDGQPRPEGVAADAPLLIVPDVQAALEALGRAARARTRARGRRRHRLGRQDLDQGDAARRAGRPGPHPCRRGQLQQPLGRAADAGADAARHRFRGDRDRHEPPRRDRAAGAHGAPACGAWSPPWRGASGGLRRHRGHRA